MQPHISEGFVIGLVMVTVTLTIGSILTALIRGRRERRVAELRAEVQSKLLDKFSSSSEALDFLRSDAGAQFTSATTFERPQAHARMLSSLQIGVVATFVGMGFFLVQENATNPEIQEPFSIFGIITVCLGLGFIASSLLGLYLSRKLGDAASTPQLPASSSLASDETT